MTLLLVLLALVAGGLLGSEISALPRQASSTVSGQVKAVGAQEPKITPANHIPAPPAR